jgi:hypothetical protein
MLFKNEIFELKIFREKAIFQNVHFDFKLKF